MKNIILTASLITNLFIGAGLWAFCNGHIARAESDYVGVLEDTVKPVKLARK